MEVNRRLNQVPRTELERRWAIVRNRLDAIGCDMLIAVGAHNTWSGGMNRWLTDYMVTYRRVVLFHRTDDMTIVEHGTMDGYRRPAADHPSYPGVGEVFSVSEFPAVSFTQEYEAQVVIDVLRRRGYRRVALHNPGAMPFAFLSAIKTALGDVVQFVDDSDFLDEAKAIKSPAEIEMIRRAARLQDEVFATVVANARPGMYDFEITAMAEHEVRLRRGRFGVYLGSSSPLGKPAHISMSEDQGRRIEPGDYFSLLIENGSPDGMFCEVMRTISFGEPAPGLVRACEQAVSAQEHTFSLMKAGVACSDIYAEYRKYMDDKGLAAETRLYSHGQGLDLVERPLIRHDETMVLRAEMNMTAHPSVSDEIGRAPSELQSLMRTSYAVFCLKKKKY